MSVCVNMCTCIWLGVFIDTLRLQLLHALCSNFPFQISNCFDQCFGSWQDGPTEYKSRTIFEDSTPDQVKDFYWDDAFRSVWDDMLIHAKTLEGCMETGAEIAHWVRKVSSYIPYSLYFLSNNLIWKISFFSWDDSNSSAD